MKGIAFKLLLAALVLSFSLSQAEAHFGTIVVSDDIVSSNLKAIPFISSSINIVLFFKEQRVQCYYLYNMSLKSAT